MAPFLLLLLTFLGSLGGTSPSPPTTSVSVNLTATRNRTEGGLQSVLTCAISLPNITTEATAGNFTVTFHNARHGLLGTFAQTRTHTSTQKSVLLPSYESLSVQTVDKASYPLFNLALLETSQVEVSQEFWCTVTRGGPTDNHSVPLTATESAHIRFPSSANFTITESGPAPSGGKKNAATKVGVCSVGEPSPTFELVKDGVYAAMLLAYLMPLREDILMRTFTDAGVAGSAIQIASFRYKAFEFELEVAETWKESVRMRFIKDNFQMTLAFGDSAALSNSSWWCEVAFGKEDTPKYRVATSDSVKMEQD